MSAVGKALSKVSKVWGEKVAPRTYEDVCSVKRKKAVGGSAALSTIHQDVPCKIPKGSGGFGGDAIRAKTTYPIEMPAYIGQLNTVQAEDFLVVEAREPFGQRTFKVQSVEQDRGIKVIARCTIES